MIKIKFFGKQNLITGFAISGHGTADEDDFSGRLVCAAVSSATYMTANTLTEIVGADADISDNGEIFKILLCSEESSSQTVLRGFLLHITALSEDYKNTIEINSEV